MKDLRTREIELLDQTANTEGKTWCFAFLQGKFCGAAMALDETIKDICWRNGVLHWPLSDVCLKFQGKEVRCCRMDSHISLSRGRQDEQNPLGNSKNKSLISMEALERK